MKGYHGRFLKVDLTAGRCTDMPLSPDDLQHYIGGATLAAALIYPHVHPGMDPLAPENPLVFATGPMTGTPIPMVSRYAVCAISPLTGYWGESTSGGKFPFRLKGTGYDGIFITGKAQAPVWLLITDEQAELRPAEDLWGRDTYQTQEAIRDQLGRKEVSTACIGLAGERGISFAAVMNDRGRAAGRCGMGAVMGAKNLKAVTVAGRRKPAYADKDEVNTLAKEALATIRNNLSAVALKEYGTLFYMDMAMALGDAPAKYYTKSVFPAEKISGQALRQRYAVEPYACQGCPIGCGRTVKNAGPGRAQVDGPEYETTGAFGPLCMNFDLDVIVEANHLCNAYGMDTISTGVSIAYAMYLFEKGVLNEDKAGLAIRWGDGAVIPRLIHMMAAGEDIGRLLAQGTLAMAKALGRDPQEAAQVKGLEIPMHDARAFHGQAVTYATGPRGACHLKGEYFNVELGGKVKEYDIYPGDRLSSEGKGAAAAKLQSLKDLYDALTLCKFAPLKVTQLCRILSAVTGQAMDPAALLAAGDRSINLKRAINNTLGLDRAGDQVPRIASAALAEGSTAGKVPDMDLLLKDYYAYRGWDWETGKPSRETLMELGLGHVAADLYPETDA
jgi:aldehyde:ferredoxin oxidoreductase